MTVTISGPGDTEWKRLANNTLTTIFTARERTGIVFMAAVENNGSTPALTLYRTDGTDNHYFLNALAFTAKQRITFDEIFWLKSGDTIKAQSGDASGKFDIYVSYIIPI